MRKITIAASIISAFLVSNFAMADNLDLTKNGVSLGNKEHKLTIENKEQKIERKQKEENFTKIKNMEKFNYQSVNIYFYTMNINNGNASLISDINKEINNSNNLDETLSKFGQVIDTSVLTMSLSPYSDYKSFYGLNYKKGYISSVTVHDDSSKNTKTSSAEWGGITASARVVNANDKFPLVNFIIKEKVLGAFEKTDDGAELPNSQENDLISTVILDQKFKAISISNFSNIKQKIYKLIIVETNFQQ